MIQIVVLNGVQQQIAHLDRPAAGQESVHQEVQQKLVVMEPAVEENLVQPVQLIVELVQLHQEQSIMSQLQEVTAVPEQASPHHGKLFSMQNPMQLPEAQLR